MVPKILCKRRQCQGWVNQKRTHLLREEEVSYENKAAGVKFAGTLTLPPGKGPFPAVLLITGTGPLDRAETALGHKPFLVLVNYLTRRGIAVLRVDDRGVGGSTGNIMQSTTEDFAVGQKPNLAHRTLMAGLPRIASQMRNLPPMPTVARSFPSGENATPKTSLGWFMASG
jgi:hypothetical protein